MTGDYNFGAGEAFRMVLDRAFEENQERHMTREKLGDAEGRIRDLEKKLASASERIRQLTEIEKGFLLLKGAVRVFLTSEHDFPKVSRAARERSLTRLRRAFDEASITEIPF